MLNRICPAIGALTFIVCGLVSQNEARAGWLYTKWGMTLDELIASTSTHIQRTEKWEQREHITGRIGEDIAKTTYQAGGIDFNVRFHFRENKLTAVAMTPKNPRDKRIKAVLYSTYGNPKIEEIDAPPDSTCTNIYQMWNSVETGNIVTLQMLKCHDSPELLGVIYSPISSPGQGGL